MRRVNLSEIHEQPWFPTRLRDHVTDTLQFVFDAGRMYRPIAARLGQAMEAAASDRVVDLCSGAGGPWIWLHRMLEDQAGEPVEVVLTDRYPNVAAFERAEKVSRGRISYRSEPVDAERVPERLSGFRTIFSSLHHFPPREVTQMLRDAADRGQGIGFFELARRRPRTVALACTIPFAVLFLVPFMRPFRWGRLVWTYLIPVIPFVLLFDGVLSCLRAYRADELREMTSQAGATNYAWEIGDAGPVSYLLGYPARRDPTAI